MKSINLPIRGAWYKWIPLYNNRVSTLTEPKIEREREREREGGGWGWKLQVLSLTSLLTFEQYPFIPTHPKNQSRVLHF